MSPSNSKLKVARVWPALAPVAAFAMMLGQAPSIAAGPVGLVAPELGSGEFHPRGRHSGTELHINRKTAPARSITTFNYDISPAIASSAELGLERREIDRSARDRAQWSPGVANWSGYDSRFYGTDRGRLKITQQGLETVVDGHTVRSWVALHRHRVQLVLSTDF